MVRSAWPAAGAMLPSATKEGLGQAERLMHFVLVAVETCSRRCASAWSQGQPQEARVRASCA